MTRLYLLSIPTQEMDKYNFEGETVSYEIYKPI